MAVHVAATIAQPFKAGIRISNRSLVPAGTAEAFFRPWRDSAEHCPRYPALKRWAIIVFAMALALPSRDNLREMQTVRGLHHVTAIAGSAQENLNFYAGR